MTRLAKLAAPLAIAAAVVITPAPAKAQFDEGQMAQFAPMLEMMKQKMGKKRFGQMMQTMGPMMENMMGQGAAAASAAVVDLVGAGSVATAAAWAAST